MAAAADAQMTLPTLEPKGPPGDGAVGTRRRTVMARTPTQDAYIRAFDRSELVFGVGPAGTGKTYLAVAYRRRHARARRGRPPRSCRARRSRPASASASCPATCARRSIPYLRPLYDALYDMMPAEKVERGLASGAIEVAPLAFMRGRTLSHAVVILDEAQNTTSMQMKMFLTRLGENSRMIVTGDPSQIDLPPGQTSGLVEAVRLLDGVAGISLVRFTAADVVRHPLVARIVDAYDAADRPKPAGGSDRRAPTTHPDKARARFAARRRPRRRGRRMAVAREAAPTRHRRDRRRVPPRRACARAAGAEVTVVFTDDAHIRVLNRRYRKKNKPTNVLSFPAPRAANGAFAPLLGDIVLAAETVAREAAKWTWRSTTTSPT